MVGEYLIYKRQFTTISGILVEPTEAHFESADCVESFLEQ